jgi:hypothetical protein
VRCGARRAAGVGQESSQREALDLNRSSVSRFLRLPGLDLSEEFLELPVWALSLVCSPGLVLGAAVQFKLGVRGVR